MKTTITLDWQRASTQQKEAWCQFVPLDEQFIKDNWKVFLTRQKMRCIVYQNLDEDFILQKWSELSDQGQIYCIRHRPFSVGFIETLWQRVKLAIRTTIVLHQNLTPVFIQQRWEEIGVHEKGILLQKYEFDTNFIESVIQKDRSKDQSWKWKNLQVQILKHQPLSQKRLSDFWKEVSNRIMLIENPNTPIDLIISHWKDVNEDLHLAALAVRIFPSSFIREYWPMLSNDERYSCLRNQRVPFDLIEKGFWSMFTEDQKAVCVINQRLPQTLIANIWTLGFTANILTFQQVAKDFLLERWKDLDDDEKTLSTKYQDCLEELPLEELPRFLTDNCKRVRQWATRQSKFKKEKQN